eukprot:scaffold183375_cov23-Tisochrysis_lutea.AAC.1
MVMQIDGGPPGGGGGGGGGRGEAQEAGASTTPASPRSSATGAAQQGLARRNAPRSHTPGHRCLGKHFRRHHSCDGCEHVRC